MCKYALLFIYKLLKINHYGNIDNITKDSETV